ncbi:LysM domain protein [Cordyceps militaris CM01]|uniref:LysM domain protein n=1 Tax=Cordyceps militaris (strain CM01) TaxID=983644 RepID=G3JTI0_CORMM|nr:LysM domain protein [Cordyceps militaris CM01]EGX87984.1 LysM domain protein [Cordyceps militaris CM01]
MQRHLLLGLAGLPALLSALRVSVTCSFSTVAANGETCDSMAAAWGLNVATFQSLNPKAKCPQVIGGEEYCVVGTVTTVTGEPTTAPTTTSTKPATTTTETTTTTITGNGIATPSPLQRDLVSNCNKFYFVKKGDICASIVEQCKIELSDFLEWNPRTGSDCSGLWADTYACVSVIGYVAKPKPTLTKPTPTGNGIPTPLPTQPGMTDGCNKFQFVNPGDTCQDVASRAGVSLSDFLRWNPKAGSACSGLWANAYACAGMISFSLKSRYHTDCSGDVHSFANVDGGDGQCMNTDCSVGSLEIASAGLCPDGEVQVSYWEQPGCQGKWFGYGYAKRGECRHLWTNGWKFKAIHLRCAKSQDDCVNQGKCTREPEPAQGVC